MATKTILAEAKFLVVLCWTVALCWRTVALAQRTMVVASVKDFC